MSNPTIPKGWHRLRGGSRTKKGDRYFNFMEHRWCNWDYIGTRVDSWLYDFLEYPVYIRKNS